MDRRLALRELPTGYALALTLRDEGHDDLTIADRLGLDPTAIGPLLRLADAKLARALTAEQLLGGELTDGARSLTNERTRRCDRD